MSNGYIGAPEDQYGYWDNVGPPDDDDGRNDEPDAFEPIECSRCDARATIDYAATRDWFIDDDGELILCTNCQ